MSVLMSYRTDEGTRTALLVGEGRKYLRLVTMAEYPMRVIKVPLSEGKWLRVMPGSLKLALRTYRGVAKRDHGSRANWPKQLKEALEA